MACFRNRHPRVRANAVIGDLFQSVRPREERRESPVDAGIVFGEASKFAASSTVGLGDLAGAVKNKRLRRMIRREVSGAARRDRKATARASCKDCRALSR